MKTRKPSILAGCISGALSLVAANAFAANLTWDFNAATGPNPADGAQTWDIATARFWNGTTNVLWTNNTADTAVFGTGGAMFNGVAGNVTVSGALTTGGLDFEPYLGNAAKYNITGGIRLQNGSSLSIGGDLGLGAAANGLTFSGTSTLITRATFTEASTHAVTTARTRRSGCLRIM